MFNEMFEYVKKVLEQNDGEAASITTFTFRRRSEHIWRVFKWAERLIENGNFPCDLDKESILIAALFHDIGYGMSLEGALHGENSAKVFRTYAREKHFDPVKAEFIEYLIRNHSGKKYLTCEEIPLELVLLMEADLLDETGALSIVWDCMAEGAEHHQSFLKAYEHIRKYSCKILTFNPMRTEIAKKYWLEKQELTRKFVNQLKVDLNLEE